MMSIASRHRDRASELWPYIARILLEQLAIFYVNHATLLSFWQSRPLLLFRRPVQLHLHLAALLYHLNQKRHRVLQLLRVAN